jgi:hypothetical protein
MATDSGISGRTIFSVVESSAHPNFSALYRRLGLKEVRLASARKTIAQLKKQSPDFLVAEFFYGYGNNYAGVNVCNLDVMLSTLQKYARQAKVIVLVEKPELQYVDRLKALFPVHGVLVQPVQEQQMAECLQALAGQQG